MAMHNSHAGEAGIVLAASVCVSVHAKTEKLLMKN